MSEIGSVSISMGGSTKRVLTIVCEDGTITVQTGGYLVPWPTGGDDANSDKGTSGRDAASD